jgi:hypothetical protein
MRYKNMTQENLYLLSTDKMLARASKPPVDRIYLERIQRDLYETIKKAEDSWDPSVSLAGIAILAKYEKLVDVIQDIKEWGLNGR